MNSFTRISEAGSRCTSKWQLLGLLLKFRILLLLAMAISCHLIPDHNPGDDVVRFDMRLGDDCFCRKGHLCEGLALTESISDDNFCAIPSRQTGTAPPWQFFLAPLTKWDAARFLNLALNPAIRDPYCDEAGCHFEASEQAHAFFPLFPNILGQVSLLAAKLLPLALLPPTFEALLVLCGFLLNTFCLVVATLSLFHLTKSILPPSISEDQQSRIAMTTCLVYGVWNPASVFFATNYSESLFSAMTLLGYCLFQSQTILGSGLGILVWTAGSYARSNGILQSLWLLLYAVSKSCLYMSQEKTKWSSKKMILQAYSAIVAAIIIAQPMKWHDTKGIDRHCQTDLPQAPGWCLITLKKDSLFSLYSYVQRVHWNVGFLNYYEWKQIPNFLLAAPILLLAGKGVLQWIHSSIKDFGKGKLSLLRLIIMQWPIHALSQSVSQIELPSSKSPEECLVHNPVLLGHYAILAILILTGTFVAHVQISTRMIWSSSPAAIWFLTYLIIQKEQPRLQLAARLYPCLYILLGVILHVNFLPWT